MYGYDVVFSELRGNNCRGVINCNVFNLLWSGFGYFPPAPPGSRGGRGGGFTFGASRAGSGKERGFIGSLFDRARSSFSREGGTPDETKTKKRKVKQRRWKTEVKGKLNNLTVQEYTCIQVIVFKLICF